MQISEILKQNVFLKYKSQDVYTDQWTVWYIIFECIKIISVKYMRPSISSDSETPVQVNHAPEP